MNPPPDAAVPAPLTGPLRQKITDAIKQKVERNWSVPAGVLDAAELVVTLRIQLGPDGSVRRVEIVDADGGANYRTMAESGRRAVLKASPFDALTRYVDRYEGWRRHHHDVQSAGVRRSLRLGGDRSRGSDGADDETIANTEWTRGAYASPHPAPSCRRRPLSGASLCCRSRQGRTPRGHYAGPCGAAADRARGSGRHERSGCRGRPQDYTGDHPQPEALRPVPRHRSGRLHQRVGRIDGAAALPGLAHHQRAGAGDGPRCSERSGPAGRSSSAFGTCSPNSSWWA